MKSADHHQDEYAEQIKALMGFKSDLGRFCRTYSYIAQLIDFGDPELRILPLRQAAAKAPSARSTGNRGLDRPGAYWI